MDVGDHINSDFQTDIDAVNRLDSVSTILDVICRTTGMGFAAVARVTEERWIACRTLDNIDFGLEAGAELTIESTICNEIRQSREAVIIDHVDQDPLYRKHLAPMQYGFQSYISVPIIRRDGSFFGTLCAIDPRPAQLKSAKVMGMFHLFAQLIATQLDADEKLTQTQTDLTNEKQLTELREQFIAVLSHDLRTPLSAIDMGTRLLQMMPSTDKAQQILAAVRSSTMRMQELIENVLNFTRVRMGNGLTLKIKTNELLLGTLKHVVDELQTIWPERKINKHFMLTEAIDCDADRISQIASNLLGNALTHGAADKPVTIHATTENGVFELWVANGGEPISATTYANIFKPFFRGKEREHQQGLGLGLYIASQVAHAHGGTLTLTSDSHETRFTFRMPLHAGQTLPARDTAEHAQVPQANRNVA